MGNTNEIIGIITIKRENAKIWYENARSACRHFSKTEEEGDLERSSISMTDMHSIKSYMDELGELIHLISLSDSVNITLFEEETREIYDNTCSLHMDHAVPLNYTYVSFFMFGANYDEAYLYIPPISSICMEKYQKYYPPSDDDGD
jgi:hypothetical protein